MLIFSLETSCDETAAAILEFTSNGKFKILANKVASQIKIHAPWGGIVPNLAAREHSKNIIPVIKKTFTEANLTPEKMDLFSVTEGPGLIPALLIGTNTVKTLSYFHQKPLIGIHHIEGHIYSNFINKDGEGNLGIKSSYNFPILNLVISGGHTQLILMKNHLEYEIIGQTQDDAVGEAYDKVAKIMGFEYPGGPIISQQANEAEKLIATGNVGEKYLEIKFPRPMLYLPNLDFSFSGLKTAVLYFYQKLEEEITNKKGILNLSKVQGKAEQRNEIYSKMNGMSSKDFDKEICQICNSNEKEIKIWKLFIAKAFQDSVIEVLQHKTLKAIKIHQPKTVLLSGGVSANNQIFKKLEKKLAEEYPEITFHSPERIFCGDNAAMIGVAGIAQYLYSKNKKTFQNNWRDLEANSNLKLK